MVEANLAVARKAVMRDWTQGGIVRNLFSLSWPMIVSESIYMLTIVDMVWVGKLGAGSLAGLGVASTVIMLGISAKVGLTTGVKALIARSVGAGDMAGANHIARQAFVLSIAYGLVMTVIGVSLAEPILNLFALQPDVGPEGVAYLRIYSLSWIPVSIWLLAYYMIQASGDTVTPMKVEVIMRVSQLVLSPFLILGWWVFPRMGVSGAAVSNVAVQSLGMALFLWYLLAGRTRLRLTFKDFRLEPKTMWRIVKIGIPASVMSAQRSVSNIIVMGFMIPFGTLAIASHSLINGIGMIAFLPTSGLGLGAGVLVGQNLGARKPERAERSGWVAAVLSQGFMVIWAIVTLIWADKIIFIFNSDPGLVQVASTFLRIAAIGYLVMGFGTALQHSISGAGDTLVPMLVSLVSMWLVTIPLAFFLIRVTATGVYGVRWALIAPFLLGAIAYTAYFRMGRWKLKKV
ncbi:MAG: MATE family efflux transporter [Chloroflexi bacterium]|nr:MATE family efflux transporter [Chloroflexota bacterium]